MPPNNYPLACFLRIGQNGQMPQTLDRLLSKLGIASRVASSKWILAGRVKVNGKIVKDPGAWVQWPKDSVKVDGREIQEQKRRFFLFHKPCGYITTHSDELGRKTIYDLLPKDLGFLHAVGRLDKATSGLLLLTNDSSLSSYLTEPKNKVPRIYRVVVWGEFSEEKIPLAKKGVVDEGELLKCESVFWEKFTKRETQLKVVLTQGKNREVRRLFEALGHTVTGLHRLEYGPFALQDLALGAHQEIPIDEVRAKLGF